MGFVQSGVHVYSGWKPFRKSSVSNNSSLNEGSHFECDNQQAITLMASAASAGDYAARAVLGLMIYGRALMLDGCVRVSSATRKELWMWKLVRIRGLKKTWPLTHSPRCISQ